jgi:hypothetical protein
VDDASSCGVFVMDQVSWIEVETGTPYTHYTPDSLIASNKIYGWWIVVQPLEKVPHHYNFECVCLCDVDNFRDGARKHVPENQEVVVVCCDSCGTPLMRVKGFVSKEWQMWLNKRLLL